MRLWLIVLFLLVAGCRGAGQFGHESAATQWPRPIKGRASPQTAHVRFVSAESSREAAAEEPNAPPLVDGGEAAGQSAGVVGLTLEEAVETALRRNPELVALRQAEPASLAALRVAKSYPHDPSVQVTVLPESRFANGETGSVVNSVQIMQTVELAHQPRYRWQAGSAQLNRTRWGIVEAELRTVAETERRFFAVLYRRRLYELRKELADLNDELLSLLRRRFEAGQATAADIALAQMEAQSSRQQAELAETALRFARLDLQTYLGLDPENPCTVVGDIEDWTWLPAREALAALIAGREPDGRSEKIPVHKLAELLAAGRPDVRAARADLEAAVAQCRLASASRLPDLNIGVVYERDEDKTLFWGGAAEMVVPVFGSRRMLALQRRAEVRQKQVALQQLTRRATMEIEASLNQYERARRLVERFDTDSDEELARQVQSVEDLFEAGQADLLRVYAARSQALQVRMDRLEALDTLARTAGALVESSGIWPPILPLLLQRTRP